MKYAQKVHIGTSGWYYQHWKGTLYPEELSEKDYLKFYSRNFTTAEINNTFYQMPEKKTLSCWRDSVPSGFIFAVKASRYITHIKKLRDSKKSLFSLLTRIDVLNEKLGPVLFQLPPRWHKNTERLRYLLDILPGEYRYTFEFRDSSWFCAEIYDMLEENQCAFCIYDLDGMLSPKKITADFIYIRLHGPDGPYKGEYAVSVLAGWAGAFSAWSRQGKEIYCYFDNDEKGFAGKNALELKEMIGGKRNYDK
ncbi:MAG: DUF72 domain-containing protein [Nitrospirota bacterium]